MDDLDRAQHEASHQLEANIAHQRYLAKQHQEEDCRECGIFIPLDRQEATGGTDLCMPCKEIVDA